MSKAKPSASSGAFDVNTIVKALDEAASFMGIDAKVESWQPINEQQSKLLVRFPTIQKDSLRFPELNAWARRTAEELNTTLAEHGFSIRLQEWVDDGKTFGVVAIYDITIEWLIEGSKDNSYGEPYWIKTDTGRSEKAPKIIPAYRLGKNANQIEFHTSGISGSPVIKIPGKNGDSVCFVRAEKALEGFELLEAVDKFRDEVKHGWSVARHYRGVVMPNILLDVQPDISWLSGLTSTNGWGISQAIMQVKFAMGPKGARAKVATGMVFATASVGPIEVDYIVDHDIILWFERPGMEVPLFSAYVSKEDFLNRYVELDEI